MYYKIETDNNWSIGNVIYLPSGDILTPENKLTLDGWEWLETEPTAYTEWVLEQANENGV